MKMFLRRSFPFFAISRVEILHTTNNQPCKGVLPEEFPFSKRREETAPEALAPIAAPIAAPAQEHVATTQANEAAPAVAAPVAPRVEHVDEEPLVEIATSGRVVYRGRERRRSPRQAKASSFRDRSTS